MSRATHRVDIHARALTLCGKPSYNGVTTVLDWCESTCRICEDVFAVLQRGETEHLTPAEARAALLKA